MRTTYITAFVIALLIGAWLLSGQLTAPAPTPHPSLAEQNRRAGVVADDEAPARVRAQISRAQPKTANIQIRGRTGNKRTVVVKAETGGRLNERAVERGQRVRTGDLLCRIDLDDRSARLAEATEALRQAQIEFDGSSQLAAKGLLSDTQIATVRARLASAHASLERIELDIEHTSIRAPFDGLIEDTHLERGDFVQPGTACATVIDLDPMLLVGRVAERDVAKVDVGAVASATLIDDTTIQGTVTFVGRQSDGTTRTYAVEIEVPNPDYAIRSGMTAQIEVPTETLLAHRVSPALLALDDSGALGLRTVGADSRVLFTTVRIVAEESGGVWVAGLPDVVKVITVGQELVVPGQRVEVDLQGGGGMPASTPTAPTDTPVDEVARKKANPAITANRAAHLVSAS